MAEHHRVVVVTGASAGVGRATALAFANQGAHLGLLARGRAGLESAAHDVEAAGARAIAIPTDVADADGVDAAAAAVEQAFGPIDVWVNNAMASVFSPVREMTAAEYRRVTDVTYLGVMHQHICRPSAHAAAQPRVNRAGRIGAGLSGHPASVSVLRRQARDQQALRFAA